MSADSSGRARRKTVADGACVTKDAHDTHATGKGSGDVHQSLFDGEAVRGRALHGGRGVQQLVHRLPRRGV